MTPEAAQWREKVVKQAKLTRAGPQPQSASGPRLLLP
jgi:hypothetical protein